MKTKMKLHLIIYSNCQFSGSLRKRDSLQSRKAEDTTHYERFA